VAATKTLQPFCARCQPNWWVHFALDVPESPVNLAGDYTLTFLANPSCTMLPEEMPFAHICDDDSRDFDGDPS
jgi:hypothetical protein